MTRIRRRPDLTPLQRGYALLLRAYPKAHRDAYGFWMRQAFDDLSADALLRGGWAGLAMLSAQVLADTLVSAARERHAAGHFRLLLVLQARSRLLMMLGAFQIALSGLAYIQPGI